MSASPPTSSTATPTDVYVGMKVQVLFEHDDDVWIPLFEPTGDPDEGSVPGRRIRTIRDFRAMPKNANKFEDHVAVTGIGMSQVGRRLMVDPIVLTVEAAKQAIADAGLDRRRHRRPVDVPGAGGRRRDVGRRRHRARRDPAATAVVDQQRPRAPRPGRFGDRGDARGRRWALQPRVVLPHGVGGDVRAARSARRSGGRRAT